MKVRVCLWLVMVASLAWPQGLVIPILNCVDQVDGVDDSRPDPKSMLVGHFGYFNLLVTDASEPVAAQNFFFPGNPNKGQPANFSAGYYAYVFSAGGSAFRDLTWILQDEQAVARVLPAVLCSAKISSLNLMPQTVKLLAGAQARGVELMKLTSNLPPSTTYAVTATVYQGVSSSTAMAPSSEVSVTNLRVAGNSVLGDLEVIPSPTRRNFVLALRFAVDGQGVAGKSMLLNVFNSCPLTVTPSALPPASLGANYLAILGATGGTAPYQYEIGAGSLPNGVQLVNGALTGSPSEAGTFSFTLDVVSSDRCLARQPYTLAVSGQICASDVTSQVAITVGGFRQNLVTGRWQQTLTLTNTSGAVIASPVMVALQSLSGNAALYNAAGVTQCALPAGRPYVRLANGIAPGQSVSVALEFTNTTPAQAITYTPRVLAGGTNQ